MKKDISVKKKEIQELIKVSSLCDLMGKQGELIQRVEALPDEASEEEEKLLETIKILIQESESDPEIKEVISTFLRTRQIKARRDKDPAAPIDDLLS